MILNVRRGFKSKRVHGGREQVKIIKVCCKKQYHFRYQSYSDKPNATQSNQIKPHQVGGGGGGGTKQCSQIQCSLIQQNSMPSKQTNIQCNSKLSRPNQYNSKQANAHCSSTLQPFNQIKVQYNCTLPAQNLFFVLQAVTFDPLNGFSKFKRLNDLEFCQEFNETNADFVQACTNEIGGIKF